MSHTWNTPSDVSLISRTCVRTPAWFSNRTVALPMPEAPPTTSPTLPLNPLAFSIASLRLRKQQHLDVAVRIQVRLGRVAQERRRQLVVQPAQTGGVQKRFVVLIRECETI